MVAKCKMLQCCVAKVGYMTDERGYSVLTCTTFLNWARCQVSSVKCQVSSVVGRVTQLAREAERVQRRAKSTALLIHHHILFDILNVSC